MHVPSADFLTHVEAASGLPSSNMGRGPREPRGMEGERWVCLMGLQGRQRTACTQHRACASARVRACASADAVRATPGLACAVPLRRNMKIRETRPRLRYHTLYFFVQTWNMKIREAHEKRRRAPQIGSHFGGGRHCFSGNSVAERFEGGMFRFHSSGSIQKGQKPLIADSSAPESCNEPLSGQIAQKISACTHGSQPSGWPASATSAARSRPLSQLATAGPHLQLLSRHSGAAFTCCCRLLSHPVH